MASPMVSAMQGGAGSSTTSPIPGSSGVRRLNRDDLIALGQSGRPWAFLPIALQVTATHPKDLGLRLLLAANWARLSLPTPAIEVLHGLPAEAAEIPEVRSLLTATRLMPADAIPPAQRIATCRANLIALGDRGPGLGPDFDSWAGRTHAVECCRAADGNIIHRTRAADPVPAGPWLSVADHTATAATWDARIAADNRAAERPLILEGVDPPWLLARLLTRRADRKDTYRPRLTILQLDRSEFFDGLSLLDMTSGLRGDHIIAFTGPDAGERLRADLRNRLEYDISGPVTSLLSVRTRLAPGPVEIASEAGREQQALTERLHAQVQQFYAGRGPGYWARRYRDALAGAGEPLRVLIPTTRNSTFVKHASADLADAFSRLGMRAELLIEPDDATRMAAPSYLRRFAELRPDLVVLINYPRAMMADAIPADLPFICWLQDAMPHLFSPERGAAHGPLDFLAGHLFEELFSRHGYPRDRAFESTILASESKFHTAAIHTSDRARFECEIAYVSHQSETPQAQHTRLRAQFAEKTSIARAIDRLAPVVQRAVARPPGMMATLLAHDLAREALREEMGSDPEPGLVDRVARAYIEPYADRLIRHETLRWASDTAERRGWRLMLYGRGWEQHPRLAAHAAGELAHGDALRMSYQCAAVHLHMTTHSLVHQRLMECILSGGFPLCRLHAAEVWEITWWLTHEGIAEGARPIPGPIPAGYPDTFRTISWADAPSLMKLAAALQRLDLLDQVYPPIDGATLGPRVNWKDYHPAPGPEVYRPDRFCAYWALNEQHDMFFHDAATMERRIEQVLARPDHREIASAAARRRISARSTYTGLARRMVEFIRDRLADQSAAPAPRKDAA
ncbi:MAG: hypothetical protein IT436_03025 [Phycisphaerales bacterium]|nr:hypothetical protein [Phycisphaerales bacterium]